MSNTDPIALIESLDSEAIRARMRDLDSQQQALKVLLRAAVRREKDRQYYQQTDAPLRKAVQG